LRPAATEFDIYTSTLTSYSSGRIWRNKYCLFNNHL